MVISLGKTSQYLYYWTPTFAILAKNEETFFWCLVKFKVALMVFLAVCHTLDHDHVKGNFILFAMNIKVVVISWGKTSHYSYIWTLVLSVSAKNTENMFRFGSSSKSF